MFASSLGGEDRPASMLEGKESSTSEETAMKIM